MWQRRWRIWWTRLYYIGTGSYTLRLVAPIIKSGFKKYVKQMSLHTNPFLPEWFKNTTCFVCLQHAFFNFLVYTWRSLCWRKGSGSLPCRKLWFSHTRWLAQTKPLKSTVQRLPTRLCIWFLNTFVMEIIIWKNIL